MNSEMNNTPKKRQRKLSPALFLTIILIITLIGWTLPLPKIKAQSNYQYKSHPEAVSLDWPAYGQAAVGARGYGLLDSHGTQVPAPMASITKVITALAILQKKPLSPGQQGATIKITAEDVAIYNDYASKGGSVVRVSDGELISEYQALQALLLPSANNMADTMARWAFGSVNNYVDYANSYVRQLGLKKTTLGDASGFSPKSVSTAEDLATLGLAFMDNSTLRDIVSQQTAELPVAGSVSNTNWLLNTDGIIGIKTGNTEQAGGCYLFAANRSIGGQDITVIGAIMGAPDLNSAITDSRPLLHSINNGFSTISAAKKDQVIGAYVSKWGDTVDIISKDDVSVLTWKTRQVIASTDIVKDNVSLTKYQPIGKLTATSWDKKSSGDLIASNSLKAPSWQWRLYKRYF
ncbi:MAG: D-alanyl-D-alanine carboxypeptidase [Candidatus Saccharibacteria bacterium]|nr:D-alanyl-D-alanine carboxypeptidase [Candidatus Saccharibacteria bacterium]